MKTADRWSQVLLKLKREHYNQQNQPKRCFKQKRIQFASVAPSITVLRARSVWINPISRAGGRFELCVQCSDCSSAVLWCRRANCSAGGPFCVTWHARKITGAKLFPAEKYQSMNKSMRCWPGRKLKRRQKKETTSKPGSSGKYGCWKLNVIDLRVNTSVHPTRDLWLFILLKPRRHLLKFWFHDRMHSWEGRGGECMSWFPNRCDVTAKWRCYIWTTIERVPECPICRRKFIKRCLWIWKAFISSTIHPSIKCFSTTHCGEDEFFSKTPIAGAGLAGEWWSRRACMDFWS